MSGTGRRPLKVGVQLPEVEYVASWSQQKAMAQRAEQLGYDSLWLGDHLIYKYEEGPPKGPWEAWSTMAALFAVTEKIEIGPLVACTSFHNPAMIAKKAATLEEISGGRLLLGLGAGWNKAEYESYGFPYDHRADRFEEAFTVIRTLLADGYVDFHGKYYDVADCTLVPQGPRAGGPPLIVGSEGPRMLRITLPYVQGWNAWYAWFGNDPDQLQPLLDKIDAACAEVGRDPATLEKSVALLVQMEGGGGRQTVYDPKDRPTEPISGTPEELAAVLRKLAALGVGHVQLVLDPNTLESIEAFAPVLTLLDQD